MKKTITLALVLSMIIGGMAFATPTPVLISAPVPVLISEETKIITINGTPVEGEVKIADSGEYLVPLRVVAESLGFKVDWFGNDKHIELVKGENLVYIKTTENYFADRRMVQKTIIKPAEIVGNTTYVSTEFVEMMLNKFVSVDETGNIMIMDVLNDEATTGNAVIKEIEGTKIYAEINGLEAYITVTGDTKYSVALSEEAITFEDLQVGDTIKITHSAVMLMIYPPQYTAFSVEKMNGKVFKEGIVTVVSENSILIGQGIEGIQINIGEDTVITNSNGELITTKEIRVGNKVKVYHSMMTTRSIPPQSPGFELVIDTDLEIK